MRAEERHQLGLRVRRARERRGLSQRSLAQLTGFSERFVLELENGRVDPRIGYLAGIARALGVSVESILSQERRTDAAGGTLEPEGADTNRRELLTLMAAGALGAIDLERLASPHVDTAWLEGAEAVSAALAAQRSTIAAENLIPATLGHLAALEARLPTTANLTAKTALLTGITLANAGRRAESYRAYALAVSLGDATTRAKSLNGMARSHEVAGDRRQALAFQDRAIGALGRSAPRLRAGLLARRAELHAVAGDDERAMLDLEAAESAMTGEYAWHYFDPETPVDLGAYRGCVLAMLGRHREAVDTFQWVLARMDADKTLWRAKIAEDQDRALAAL